MKDQLRKRAGIFSCNDFAVISDHNESLGWGNKGCGKVYTWVNRVSPVALGVYGQPGVTTSSWLNTQVFILAWDTLMGSGKLWKHDWVIKVDPDAVFLADRLRGRLATMGGGSRYLLNCNYNGPKIFGALEVFSTPAIADYHARADQCKNLPWHGWGEDSYMEKCMQSLGALGIQDFSLVGDERCGFAPCSDGSRVAFHAFKSVPAWDGCWNTAIR